MSYLIFNGVPSTAVYARIAQPPDYKIPGRSYTSFNIAGKNGASIIDNNYFDNIEITYSMILDASKKYTSFEASKKNTLFSDIASKIASWLNPVNVSKNGYYKLIESHDPTHFRWAKPKGDISITNAFYKAGSFEITFDCMPQRFLVDGAKVSQFTWVYNTDQIAKPIITFTSTKSKASVQITNTANTTKYYHKIVCSSNGSTQTVNSVEEDCYNGSTNKNSEIYFLHSVDGNTWLDSYDFPELYPGRSTITLDGVTNFQIISNTWEL